MTKPVALNVYGQVIAMRTDAWCERCLLPSVFETDMTMSFDKPGVQLLAIRQCVECGTDGRSQ